MNFLKLKRRNKFGAIKTKCLTKLHPVHDSRFEALQCNRILAMKKNKEINTYKTQIIFDLAPGINHVVDFLLKHNDGILEVIEAKGHSTYAWRIKRKLFEQKYPHIKYTVVFNTPWKSWKKK